MKILTIHASHITFKPTKKALKTAPEASEEEKTVKECLVVFSAVEKRDEENIGGIVQRYVHEIKDVASQVKAKNIVLYPYAHLSSQLAAPDKAQIVLEEAEKLLQKEGFAVTRAPFGWYKSFEISCKGHPLSELSREFTAEAAEGERAKKKEVESEALKAEKKLVSHWHILDIDGKLHKIEKKDAKLAGFDFSRWKNLERLAKYEITKVREVHEEPPHVKYMRKLAIADHEPASDPGNLRYYPKGRLIKSLLEQFVTERMIAYGAVEVETPIMYDLEHPSLKSYLHRFPARQYTIETPNKKVFLRFAACFGQLLMAHDAQISYKDLPLRLYELTRYSFRVEQHGELTGLRRLRAFTMPDCHALAKDLEQAKKEMKLRFMVAKQIQEEMGVNPQEDLEFAIRTTKDFYEKNKNFIAELVRMWGKPALVEMWEERFFYYVMKYEWNFVDALEKASALTTDQIDVENAERYDINYVDTGGKKQHPLILHLSPSGAVERVMYALLEKAGFAEKQGKPPMLPLWLSPVQVRIIPVSPEQHLSFCENLMQELEAKEIRADIDDRVESVGKRIREAEIEWVPYTLVVGEKEVQGKEFMLRDREQDKEYPVTKEALIKSIKAKTAGKPFKHLPLPKELSRRPIFA